MSSPKLNLFAIQQESWTHHRSGWRVCLDSMSYLHTNSGVAFYGWLDAYAAANSISQNFVGFLHNTPRHPEGYHNKYTRIPSLDRIFDSNRWRENEKFCKGIFTLTNYTANFIQTRTKVPVSVIPHPIDTPLRQFSIEAFDNNPDPKIILTGHWMRRFETFELLRTGYRKVILKCNHVPVTSVEVMDWVSHSKYDELLSQNVVFLDLFDVAACNSILDCIARNTPILLNRLQAAEEYLGENYPLFYDNFEEATSLLRRENVVNAHKYLVEMDKSWLDLSCFPENIANSCVYRELPTRKIF